MSSSSSLLMQYKNYVWPRNPERINVTLENNIKDIELPKNASVLQFYGRKKRIVNGTGNFVGEDCFNNFKTLFDLFKKSVNKSEYLCIPNIEPFLAVFKDLKLIGEPSPDLVTYNFTFWEDTENIYENEINTKTNYYIADGSETLWDIAIIYDIAIEELLKLNDFIKDPGETLDMGVRISLCSNIL